MFKIKTVLEARIALLGPVRHVRREATIMSFDHPSGLMASSLHDKIFGAAAEVQSFALLAY